MPRRLSSFRRRIAELAHPEWNVALNAERLLVHALPRLRRSRSRVVQLLVHATRSPSPVARWRAAYLLAHSRSAQAFDPIRALVEDPNQEVRYEAILALGQLRDPRALPHLARLVREAPPRVPERSWAGRALGTMGMMAVPTLIHLLKTGSADARREAAVALNDMRIYLGEPRALLEQIEEAARSGDAGVQAAMEEALREQRTWRV